MGIDVALYVNDLPLAINKQINSLTIVDSATFNADTIEVQVSDPGQRLEMTQRGVVVTVEIGGEAFGQYTIRDDLKSSSGLYVMYGYSFNDKLSLKNVKLKTYPGSGYRENKGPLLSEVLSIVAKRNGLTLKLAERADFRYENAVVQNSESDSHFLLRLCRGSDLSLKIDGDSLLVKPRGDGLRISGLEMPAAFLAETDISSWSRKLSVRYGYDAVKAELRNYRANTSEIVTIRKGDSQIPSTDEKAFRLPGHFLDKEKMLKAMEAKLEQLNGRMDRISIAAPGDPLLRAEAIVELSDFQDSDLNGRWIIESITHEISESSGYKVTFQAIRPSKNRGS